MAANFRDAGQVRGRIRSNPAQYIPPLPRFTLMYLLHAAPEIRSRILHILQGSPQTLLDLRFVSKAFAEYTSRYLFKQIWLVFKSDYWKERDMAALKRIGHNIQRIIFVFKHNQCEIRNLRLPSATKNTRIPYANKRDYVIELPASPEEYEGQRLVWTAIDHLNPVPEIIELRLVPGEEEPTEESGKNKNRTARVRTSIPTEKTGGPPDTTLYGPLFHTAASIKPFIEMFKCMPNLTSLVVQTPGDDTYWEYTSVDIALESLRLGAIKAGVKLKELSLMPVHILGLESLSAVARRDDMIPQSLALLGCGGLRKLELVINVKVLLRAAEGSARSKLIYGRIVRAFVLALGHIGRNGLEILKFQWLGGENGPSAHAVDCPFFVSSLDICNEDEDVSICASLVFPNLNRLYIRNVATTASAMTDFFRNRAQRCSFVSNRMVVLKDGTSLSYAMNGFEGLWETSTTTSADIQPQTTDIELDYFEEEVSRFSGDFTRAKK